MRTLGYHPVYLLIDLHVRATEDFRLLDRSVSAHAHNHTDSDFAGMPNPYSVGLH